MDCAARLLRLSINDIEADHDWPTCGNFIDDHGLLIAGPGPPPDLLQAFLVNEDQHHFLARYTLTSQSKLEIQGSIIETHDNVGG